MKNEIKQKGRGWYNFKLFLYFCLIGDKQLVLTKASNTFGIVKIYQIPNLDKLSSSFACSKFYNTDHHRIQNKFSRPNSNIESALSL